MDHRGLSIQPSGLKHPTPETTAYIPGQWLGDQKGPSRTVSPKSEGFRNLLETPAQPLFLFPSLEYEPKREEHNVLLAGCEDENPEVSTARVAATSPSWSVSYLRYARLCSCAKGQTLGDEQHNNQTTSGVNKCCMASHKPHATLCPGGSGTLSLANK